MKNGKSAGPDKLEVEYIKYAPIEIHAEIAEIFNKLNRKWRKFERTGFRSTKTIEKAKKSKRTSRESESYHPAFSIDHLHARSHL